MTGSAPMPGAPLPGPGEPLPGPGEPLPKVLVADDDPDLTTLLAMAFEEQGYRVEVANDGLAARDLALRSVPDVVVLDVMMPGMDGLEVLTVLKNRSATADIPVVLVTAKAGDAEVWRGWQSGAAYYITKPFDLDALVRFVETLVPPPRSARQSA